jgi:hypothetical protein
LLSRIVTFLSIIKSSVTYKQEVLKNSDFDVI